MVETNSHINTAIDEDYLSTWVGRTESKEEIIVAEPLHGMRATLDLDAIEFGAGSAVPPLWHWAFFLSKTKASDLGHDGHAALGDFMPPVPLPRRMWAGGQTHFLAPLKVGEIARKDSTIKGIQFKEGRTGNLCFVEVEHVFRVNEETRIIETHNIVYRNIPDKSSSTVSPLVPPSNAMWTRKVTANSALLFRYSALTFNGHRIHYDREFCLKVEGYPGLVCHGPLTATMLLELAKENNPGREIETYRYKAISPIFDTAPFMINGRSEGEKVELWASTAEGHTAMLANVTFSS